MLLCAVVVLPVGVVVLWWPCLWVAYSRLHWVVHCTQGVCRKSFDTKGLGRGEGRGLALSPYTVRLYAYQRLSAH